MSNTESFTIELAKRKIRITPQYDEVRELCKDYIVQADGFDFEVATDQADLDFERKKSLQQDELEGRPHIEWSDSYLETLAVYRQIATRMLDYDTVLFHGSAIEIDGEAILFTGPSGSGKSTHARLWFENISGVRFINDDKPLIQFVTDYNGEARSIVYGTPWAGKHRRSSNASAPIKAICVIKQSLMNRVEEFSVDEAYSTLIQQTFRPEDPSGVIKTIKLVDLISKNGIRFYNIYCNKENEASILAHQSIK